MATTAFWLSGAHSENPSALIGSVPLLPAQRNGFRRSPRGSLPHRFEQFLNRRLQAGPGSSRCQRPARSSRIEQPLAVPTFPPAHPTAQVVPHTQVSMGRYFTPLRKTQSQSTIQPAGLGYLTAMKWKLAVSRAHGRCRQKRELSGGDAFTLIELLVVPGAPSSRRVRRAFKINYEGGCCNQSADWLRPRRGFDHDHRNRCASDALGTIGITRRHCLCRIGRYGIPNVACRTVQLPVDRAC